MNTLVFLQNAWSPRYAGKTWPRKSWLRALEKSRSGQRLRLLIGDNFDMCENISPHVSASPDGVEKLDREHIHKIIMRRKPDIIIACGNHAGKYFAENWFGRLIVIPHPAHRLLTNELYLEAKKLWGTLDWSHYERCRLKQVKGVIIKERIY